MLTVAGLQVPVMPLLDVAGSTGVVAPLHIGTMAAKVGVTCGLTVKVRVTILSQPTALGWLWV